MTELGQNVRRWRWATHEEQLHSEFRTKGDIAPVIAWYEDGADGQIDWGEDGDFEQCVAIASKYIDDPEGFCQLRHIAATGEPAGKAPGEGEDKSANSSVENRQTEVRTRTLNGKPTRSAALAERFRAPMVGAYQNKSAAQLKEVMQSLYVSSYLAGLAAASTGPGGPQILSGLQADPDYANMLNDDGDVDPDATDNVDTDNAPGKLGLLLAAIAVSVPNILAYMSQDGTPSPIDQAVQMANTETASGVEAGVQDGAQAGGFTQMEPVPDDNACSVCTDAEPYDIGDDGPPWHPGCGCESKPSGASDSSDDSDAAPADEQDDNTPGDDSTRSVLGKYVRRDWQQWDLEHPYVPKESSESKHSDPESVRTITEDEARGNSRPVSQAEFNALAVEGQVKLLDINGNGRPTTAFDDASKFQAVKDSAYAETQKPWGGQTIDPQSGKVQNFTDGYTLSIKQSGAGSISVHDGAGQDQFNSAMDRAKSTFATELQGQGTYLGVFHDDDLKRTDIDPVVHVATVHDVEAIGAATHAIGGAYDHATGDGVFPPHVPSAGRQHDSSISEEYVRSR